MKFKSSFFTSWYIFLQFFRRDFFVHMHYLRSYAINYVVLYPLIQALCVAYLQANIYFGTSSTRMGTTLFAGNVLLVLLIFTYKRTVELLFDLENNRFIEYQITMLNPRLVILQRILFISLLTFAITVPFYPLAKLFLGNYIDTSNTSWVQLYVILYLTSLCCTAYHQCIILLLKDSRQISFLWSRVNTILLLLGGFQIPRYVMQSYSITLSCLIYLNPLTYASEGLRRAILGDTIFLPFITCASILTLFAITFTVITLHVFKKRVDHI